MLNGHFVTIRTCAGIRHIQFFRWSRFTATKVVVISTVSSILRDTSIAPPGLSAKDVLLGGTVAGVLDGLDAILYFGITSGA